MKLLVIGASQGTGALTVEAALARGHQVTAFARNPQRLQLDSPNITRVSGNFHEPPSVLAAVPGHDAVIVTASSTSMKGFKQQPDYFSRGTRAVIDAMKTTGVRRLVVLSAYGAGDSRRLANFIFDKLIIGWLLALPYADHDRQETLVRESGLDWVIARPTRLTNGPARKRYQATAEIVKVPSAIARADVADFLVEAATTDAWLGKTVQLGG
jgi:uncharacterized protein YbjT (DUF2867 family)